MLHCSATLQHITVVGPWMTSRRGNLLGAVHWKQVPQKTTFHSCAARRPGGVCVWLIHIAALRNAVSPERINVEHSDFLQVASEHFISLLLFTSTCLWATGIKPLRSPSRYCDELIAVGEHTALALRLGITARYYGRERHRNTIIFEQINVDTSGFQHLASENFLHSFFSIYYCAKLT